MERRLERLERLAKVCVDEVRALQVLVIDPDTGAARDAHTGEVYPAPEAALDAERTIYITQRQPERKTE